MGLTHEHAPETPGLTISWARPYDMLVTVLTRGREDKFRKTTLDLADPRAGESVLDVACGTGTLALGAKERVGAEGKVCGLDAAPKMVERARWKAARAGADVAFELAVAEQIPFPDAQFDLVLCTLALHHFPASIRGRALAEILRVLKPDGRLLALDMKGVIQNNLDLVHQTGFSAIETGDAGGFLFGRFSYLKAKKR
jgi:ubiquinone/menaquinone biosynthesis C-methylase UbiE